MRRSCPVGRAFETPMIVGLAAFMERTDTHLLILSAGLTAAALRAEKPTFALYCEQMNVLMSCESFITIYSLLGLDDDTLELLHAIRYSPEVVTNPKHAECEPGHAHRPSRDAVNGG
jgi:hypothetical protein